MHLFIKQKVFSIRDRFMVYGEDEQEKYQVEGKIVSIGKKLRVLKGQQELARIEQEVLHILAHYNIHVEGKGDFKIIRKFSFLKPKYVIEGIDWSVEGDYWAHNYKIVDSSGTEIATISKKWVSFGDAYDIFIHKDEHEMIALCIVLSIDADSATSENVTVQVGNN